MKTIIRKRFGQNFLIDHHYISRFISFLEQKKPSHVLEIGPGRGALTFPLLQAFGTLTAIEIDRDLCVYLEENASQYGDLHLIKEDALKVPLSTFQENSPLSIVGNLPYYISTPLLFNFLKAIPPVKEILVLLQKEVVARSCANPGSKEYGRLSVMLQYFGTVTPLWTIPASAFYPKPEVDSQVLYLQPHQDKALLNPLEFDRFSTIVRTAFNHRRKILRKTLSSYVSLEAYHALDISPLSRPEELSPEAFLRLSLFTQTK